MLREEDAGEEDAGEEDAERRKCVEKMLEEEDAGRGGRREKMTLKKRML